MIRKSILVENQEMRRLLFLIKSHYKSDSIDGTIKEVNISHIASKITDMAVKDYVVSCWYNLQNKVGHEVTLLENNCEKSFINRLYKKSSDLSFVIKTRPDHTSDEVHESIKKACNISVVIKEFDL